MVANSRLRRVVFCLSGIAGGPGGIWLGSSQSGAQVWVFGAVCLSLAGAAELLGLATISPKCLEFVCGVCLSLGVGAECLVSVTSSRCSADI